VRLDCGGRPLDLGRVVVMGILNITPDSFSDGGVFFARDKAVARAREMVEQGAAIIDIGGESTRPGARAVSLQEELDRVLPVIEALRTAVPAVLSIDTSKPAVMRAAVAAGAGLVNDVMALRAEGAVQTVADLGVPVCLMHMQGEPRSMQDSPQYADVLAEVREFLTQRRTVCIDAGIPLERIILDPGFGFGKTLAHNCALLRGLASLRDLGAPLLVGLSRKSMIAKALGLPVEQRLYASLALAALAVQNGASIVRTHDVAATRDVVRMTEVILTSGIS
jgi:dihydropteroate synthase